MVTGMMIFIFALMFFGLAASVYSTIPKLKGKQRGSLHRKRDPEDPHGKWKLTGYLDPADSERS
jgi:hypothetical protein